MGLAQRVYAYVAQCYLMYELNTSVYMMDRPAKLMLNTTLLVLVSLLMYSSFVYLPNYLNTMLAFFVAFDPSYSAHSDPSRTLHAASSQAPAA